MSMQMSSGSEELHEGKAFNGDSSEATVSGGPIEVHNSVGDLFEEIDRYRDQDQATFFDLFDEIDAYCEDETGAVEPINNELAGPFSTIGVDEPVIVTSIPGTLTPSNPKCLRPITDVFDVAHP